MIRRFLLPLLTTTAFALSGCAVPDAVAHLVKKVNERNQSQHASEAAPAPAVRPAAYDEPPPPSPAPAPRDSIEVEQLPPPRS